MDKVYGKWEVIKELGEGGQGTVFLVKDTEKTGGTLKNLALIKKAISGLASSQSEETQRQLERMFIESISKLNPNTIDPSALGALKVLHKPKEDAGHEKAKGRMKHEIEALSSIDHPNILKILDHNLDEGWFVGEYHPQGPLSLHQSFFKGDMLSALEAFQPLVEGVAELHKASIVHRDIKPHNVFLSTDNRLVLGDMGIVFFTDEFHTRRTDSYENVGSRDWMAPWAMSVRIEDVHPSFDVFSLGKLLWAMVSGRTLFPLWYHHKPDYELEKMFPGDESILWARGVLDECIVENEKDCLRDAEGLLSWVGAAFQAVRRHAQVVAEGVPRRCGICALGQYNHIINEDITALRNFGLDPSGVSTFKVFTCSHCGHVQMFHIPDPKSKPRAWGK